jgi:hypothetical protein
MQPVAAYFETCCSGSLQRNNCTPEHEHAASDVAAMRLKRAGEFRADGRPRGRPHDYER